MRIPALLVLAACGGSSSTSDSVGPDALESMGSVTVIVTENGAPVSGVPVVFQAEVDGAKAFSAVTSASGSCGSEVQGFVTVMLPKERFGLDRLYTFTGAKTGDTLHLDLGESGSKIATTVGVTITPDGANPGPYLLYTTCGDDPAAMLSGVNEVLLSCSGTVGMLVARIDPNTNNVIATHFEMVDVGAPVTLGGTYAAVDVVAVTYTGAAGFVGTTELTLAAKARVFAAFSSTAEPTLVRPQTGPATSLLTASSATPITTDLDEQTIYDYRALPPVGTPLAIDMAPHLAKYGSGGSFDPASNRIVWSTRDAGTIASDVARASARFVRDDIPVGSAWTWQVIGKRDGEAAVQLPKLPVTTFDFNPRATDTTTIEELTNVALPAGTTYDAIRAHGFDDMNRWVTSASGRMIVERRWTPEPVE